ncbi:plasminogen-binding N-terminal domain-containing protein [Sulfurovum sp.]|uniref:plasminogen-binding N-terminal domain-containing protein n=1 Tax=Sulfurovum sp. TaxID=1969726 RepID=UPI0025F2D09B|nr:plasminogen-binding N-terminal domain-containing protein [Sulfurovum sp.]
MRQIVLIALTALPLFAGFFPSTVQTSVSSVGEKRIMLNSALPVNGMSGVIVHNYGNELEAIISYVTQTSSDGNAQLIDTDIIHHDELPTIKTAVASGDKVIGGYLYNNVLLLAPDADTYAKITASHSKTWIHPDLYALFLSEEGEATPTKENLAAFAKAYQVGLIYIVKNGSAVLLDPISGNIVGQKTMTGLPAKAQYPFYMRFDEIQTGWFSKSGKGDYYKTMEKI